MQIILVRHGQSEVNINKAGFADKPTVLGGLTPEGVAQVHQLVENIWPYCYYQATPLHIWHSPYERAVQTKNLLVEGFGKIGINSNSTESIYLAEQQFGVFEDQLIQTPDTAEWNHWNKHVDNEQTFWARPPMGESCFDVAIRADFFLKNYLMPKINNAESGNVTLLVSHGMWINAFLMMYLGLTYQECQNLEPIPNGAALILEEGMIIEKIGVPR